MKTRLRIICIAVLVGALAAGASWAQFETSEKARVGIRLSGLMPSDNKISDMGSTWISPALDFNILHDKYDRPSLILSLAWYTNEKGSSKAECIPITLEYVKRFQMKSGPMYYFGGGVGMYRQKYDTWGFGRTAPFRYGYWEASGSEPGVSVMGGMEWSGGWFAEINYQKVGNITNGSVGGVGFDGVTLSFGSRMAL